MKPKFETVGQIRQGNPLFAYEDSSVFDVATDLLHSRFTGMPVVDADRHVLGVVSEQDILRALRGPRSLEEITVKEIMTKSPIVVQEKTTLEEASKIMEDGHLHRLPVVEDRVLVGTLTRHDLIRAWLGLSVEL